MISQTRVCLDITTSTGAICARRVVGIQKTYGYARQGTGEVSDSKARREESLCSWAAVLEQGGQSAPGYGLIIMLRAQEGRTTSLHISVHSTSGR